MQILRGCFNGTGAAVYLCLGAIPRAFKYMNVQVATNPNVIEWNSSMVKEVLAYGGVKWTTGSTYMACTKLTTDGVFPYEGGDMLTATNQTSVGYGEGVYLGWDLKNYQADYDYGSGTSGTPINKWTFVTGLTGYWNVAKVASGARVGVGSRIRIKEDSTGLVKESCVTALTSDGEVSAEVTLSRAIGSGTITFLGGMYDLAPIALGKVTPAGVYLGGETVVNVNNDMIVFEAAIDED
jgi:hypothetical protein